MKKIIFILLSLFSILTNYSQKEDKIKTIYIENVNTYKENKLNQIIYFSVKSIDKRFNHDIYFFKVYDINSPFKKRSLKSIGKEINLDTIKYITPKYFENKSANETHTNFSINNNFRIVSKVDLENDSKYLVWNVLYFGTVKDFIFTNFGKI